MKRALILGVGVVALSWILPANAQFLKNLEHSLLGGAGQQGGMPGQAQFIGNVSLPTGNYMMSNVQTGQAFYVSVQNGQMYLSQGTTPAGYGGLMPGQNGGGLPPSFGGFMPGQNGGGLAPGGQQQGSGLGGVMRGGFGNFLKNELMPGQQQQPMLQPGQ